MTGTRPAHGTARPRLQGTGAIDQVCPSAAVADLTTSSPANSRRRCVHAGAHLRVDGEDGDLLARLWRPAPRDLRGVAVPLGAMQRVLSWSSLQTRSWRACSFVCTGVVACHGSAHVVSRTRPVRRHSFCSSFLLRREARIGDGGDRQERAPEGGSTPGHDRGTVPRRVSRKRLRRGCSVAQSATSTPTGGITPVRTPASFSGTTRWRRHAAPPDAGAAPIDMS